MTTELERQRTEELTELAQSMSYGDIHAGVDKTVHRIVSVSDDLKEKYHDIAGELLHISRQLQKSVLQQMQDIRRGGKQSEESPLVAKADFVLDPKANAIGYGMLATAQLRRMMQQNHGGEFFAQG